MKVQHEWTEINCETDLGGLKLSETHRMPFEAGALVRTVYYDEHHGLAIALVYVPASELRTLPRKTKAR